MVDLIVQAAVGKHSKSPFWMQGIVQGCRLQVSAPNEFPIVGRAVVPAGTLLTFWGAGGDGGDDYAQFWIVQMNRAEPPQFLRSSRFYLFGQFTILAQAEHSVGDEDEPSRRLRRWWLEWSPTRGGQTAEIARWLGQEIKTRKDTPADYPQPLPAKPALPFDPVDGWPS